MSLWRQLTHGFRALARPSIVDREIDDEVQHYLDEATAAHVARGLSPEDARRAARLELGGAANVSDQMRASGWNYLVDTVIGDVRYAARRLRRSPGFTTIAVLTLAVGIGGTTAIFSAVYPILFAPLPYPHADRVAGVLEVHDDGSRGEGTFAMYREFLERARSFDAIAVSRAWQPTITGADQPERFEGQRVSAGFFRVLGVAPVVGRDFLDSDDRFKGPNVVILSDTLWRRRFNADASIVGRDITLDDNLYRVIGVMPAGFENVLAPSEGIWTPLQYDPSLPASGREWGHHLRTIARLRPGVDTAAATRDISALGHALVNARHPDTYGPNTQFAVVLLQNELTRGVRPALLAIFGAVALVLMIGCVNVTNLLLARGAQRRGELALRAALGAGRGRLVRQLLTESALIAVMGGAAGILVATFAIRALVALSPAGLPRAGSIHVDATVFAFAAGVASIAGLVFGSISAWYTAQHDPHHDLQQTSRRGAGAHFRTRSTLVVAEVALAVMLLVSTGLLVRSLQRLFAVPIGFDANGVVTMQIQIVGHRFDLPAAKHRFFEQALDAVRRVPGVASAGLTSQLPLSGDHDQYGAHFDATPTLPAATYGVFRYAVTPGYLETTRIPLRAGRLLDGHDGAGAPLVAVVSESVAAKRFGGTAAIGQQLRIGPAGPFTIVGIVGGVKQLSLALTDSDAVYINAEQSWFADNPMSLVVHATGGDAAALVGSIRQAVWSVDKDQPVVRVATLDTLVAASAAERRFAVVIFEAFALAALLMAAAGIYGVLSGSVIERTREIGVRAALGASRGQILNMVLRQGLTLTVVGIALGLGGAIAATQAIVAMLFGVSRLDPVTYLVVVALLGVISLAACGVPAWRAVHVDPALTLRAE